MLTLIYDDGGDDGCGLVRELVNYDCSLAPNSRFELPCELSKVKLQSGYSTLHLFEKEYI